MDGTLRFLCERVAAARYCALLPRRSDILIQRLAFSGTAGSVRLTGILAFFSSPLHVNVLLSLHTDMVNNAHFL